MASFWLAAEIDSKLGNLSVAKFAEFASDRFAALCCAGAVGHQRKSDSESSALQSRRLKSAIIFSVGYRVDRRFSKSSNCISRRNKHALFEDCAVVSMSAVCISISTGAGKWSAG
jgi:hypothetical protein